VADDRREGELDPHASQHLQRKSSAPRAISYELRQVFVELKELAMKTGARHGYIFIRQNGARIKDICRAFEVALERAELELDKSGITPHSFRGACITRWTALGIAPNIVKRASGHTDGSVHGDYLILTDEMMVRPFREKG
jgi:integrase